MNIQQVKGFSTKIIRLSPDDENHLNQLFGISRLIWNTCLGYKKELWETYKRRNPCVDNDIELKSIRQLENGYTLIKELSKKKIRELPEYDFLLDCPAKAVQNVVRKLDSTYSRFYKGKISYPQFKKKSGLNSIMFDGPASIIKVNFKYIKIKTNGMFFIVKNPIKGNSRIFNKTTKICMTTISRKPNGNYYISVNYSYHCKESKPVKKIKTTIGIDRGVTTTASCFNGKVGQEFCIDKIEIEKLNQRIKKLQRQMDKKTKDSNNRKKARIKLAKISNRKVNIKTDFNHKLSNYLVKNHDLIVMEDLKIKNMTKSAKGTVKNPGVNVKQKNGLNRAILDNNWGQLKEMITYKAKWQGKHLILVSPSYTSQKCSNCGHVEKENRKAKVFSCLSCQTIMDADLNAAKNIRTAGLAGIAGGGFSLEKPLKQELAKLKI